MTEYNLIIVLVVVVALVAFKLFGAQIKALLTGASAQVAATTKSPVP
jgi:Flp pilus assembly pilin Flp